MKAKRGTVRALVQEGRVYAIYYHGPSPAEITIQLPAGKYRAEWVSTKTGAIDKSEDVRHDGGERTLVSPEFKEDIALGVKQR